MASVSTQFKSQLAQLMKKVSSTMPHYIRCLKPNDQSMADKFDRLRTTEQLRYGGVLEAVRVARSGFPVRLPHIDFYSRYRCLVSSSCKPRSPSLLCIQGSAGGNNIARNGITPKDRVDQCNALLSALWEDKGGLSYRDKSTGNRHLEPSGISRISRDNIQCGITKVFLRKKAHDMLEGQRSRALRATAIKIQCWYRTYLVRRHYLAILSAVNLIQRHYRGSSARRWAASIRWDRAVLRVQTAWRTALIIKRYSRFRVALITLQSMWRRRAAKIIVFTYVVIRNSVHLQRIVRGALARMKWRRLRRAIIGKNAACS